MTPEREAYHKLLTEFAASLPSGVLVYDIGRTRAHYYRGLFFRQRYVTIDREEKAAADYAIDVETDERDEIAGWADALLCNGVTESATNPFKLVEGCYDLLKSGGRALFGIRLLGYPLSPKHDFTRFTPQGAVRLVESVRFRQLTESVILSADAVPTYSFITCFK